MRRLLHPVLALALLALPALAARLHASDPTTQFNVPQDEADQEAKSWTEMQMEAAEFHRGRAHATAAQQDDEAARLKLERARQLLTSGHEIRARWWAEDVFKYHPYSHRLGDSLRMGLEGAAVHGDISEVREKLQMLWLYTPDYAGMGEAMERAMSIAEDVQDFSKSVNLEAEDPGAVIDLEGRGMANDQQTNRLLRFLAQHGDRETIAPRAALGQARGMLLAGGKEDIFAARHAYEQFLEDYPANPLTFTAICEYALSYLVSYRGKDYDIGTLVMANAIIDQAEIETRGDKVRADIVQAYRKRIRAWHQDRDLSVARWYRARGTPWILRWLKKPPELLAWDDGARYFYREVIKRDATSLQGRSAERELAEVPQTRPDTLGAVVR